MTLVAQRIAIAEACGFQPTELKTLGGYAIWHKDGQSYALLHRPGEGCQWLPDYCNDCNAMREAAQHCIRSLKQESEFSHWLFHIQKRDNWNTVSDWRFNAINATAEQRAEALLRVIGQWEETGA